VSDAIKESLHRLHQAVGQLEQSVAAAAAKTAAKKGVKPAAPDLFSAVDHKHTPYPNGTNVKHLAARLDTAILKVEQILKEGRA